MIYNKHNVKNVIIETSYRKYKVLYKNRSWILQNIITKKEFTTTLSEILEAVNRHGVCKQKQIYELWT
jgi:hypothetical protein